MPDPADTKQKDQRVEYPYWDGLNMVAGPSLSKREEPRWSLNMRSSLIGTLETRDGKTRLCTGAHGILGLSSFSKLAGTARSGGGLFDGLISFSGVSPSLATIEASYLNGTTRSNHTIYSYGYATTVPFTSTVVDDWLFAVNGSLNNVAVNVTTGGATGYDSLTLNSGANSMYGSPRAACVNYYKGNLWLGDITVDPYYTVKNFFTVAGSLKISTDSTSGLFAGESIVTRTGYPWPFGSTSNSPVALAAIDDSYVVSLSAQPPNASPLVWSSISAASSDNWASLCYGGGKFVAVSNAALSTYRVMTSTDGAVWSGKSVPVPANQWNSVCYGNGVFVAVAGTGTLDRVMSSTDGESWYTRVNPEDNLWNSVCYGNGVFVAVASSGTNRVMTSPDGINWTARSAASAKSWTSVCFGGGKFVAVSSSTSADHVMTSTDGITWTSRQAAYNSVNWKSVTYGNGRFVAVGDDGINTGHRMFSLDGQIWSIPQTLTNTTGYLYSSVTFGNGTFFAVCPKAGAGNRASSSFDGDIWYDAPSSVSGFDSSAVAYGSGKFVVVAPGTTVITSPAGFDLNFTAIASSVRYPNAVLQSSPPIGLISQVSEDLPASSSEIQLTDTTYIRIGETLEIWRGQEQITTVVVSDVGQTSITVSPVTSVAVLSADLVWASGTKSGHQYFRWPDFRFGASNAAGLSFVGTQRSGSITMMANVGNSQLIGTQESLTVHNGVSFLNMDYGVGCPSRRGWVLASQGLYFMSYKGIFRSAGAEPELISMPVRPLLETFTRTQIEGCVASLKGDSVMFFVPGTVTRLSDDGTPQTGLTGVCIEYDLRQQNFYVHSNLGASSAVCMAIDGKDTLVTSDPLHSSLLYKTIEGVDDDGEAIAWEVERAPLYANTSKELYSYVWRCLLDLLRGDSADLYLGVDGEKAKPIKAQFRKGLSHVETTPPGEGGEMVRGRIFRFILRGMAFRKVVLGWFAVDLIMANEIDPAGDKAHGGFENQL